MASGTPTGTSTAAAPMPDGMAPHRQPASRLICTSWHRPPNCFPTDVGHTRFNPLIGLLAVRTVDGADGVLDLGRFQSLDRAVGCSDDIEAEAQAFRKQVSIP